MIRRGRFGLTAPPGPGPGRLAFRGRHTAGRLSSVRLGLVHVVGYLLRGVRSEGGGIEVSLRWHRTTGQLAVSVPDAASGASFELPVAAHEALTAVHHPYAYAAGQGVAY